MDALDQINPELAKAIQLGESERAVELAQRGLGEGVDLQIIFDDCVVPTLKEAGDRFGRANELIQQIVPKYEDLLGSKTKGKRFDEAYDMHTLRPTDEWITNYPIDCLSLRRGDSRIPPSIGELRSAILLKEKTLLRFF